MLTYDKSATLYCQHNDPVKRDTAWRRVQLPVVSWKADRIVATGENGLHSSDVVKVRILDGDMPPGYVTPGEFTGAEGTWTVQTGDLLIYGLLDIDIAMPSNLPGKYYTVSHWSDNRRIALKHFRIEAG